MSWGAVFHLLASLEPSDGDFWTCTSRRYARVIALCVAIRWVVVYLGKEPGLPKFSSAPTLRGIFHLPTFE